MLAFAKDISITDPDHPEEEKHPQLKDYMDYQRKLKHDQLIFHALDHAKTYLQKNQSDCEGDEAKLKEYAENAFPYSHKFTDPDTLLMMLRKLINAQNSTNNWYRLNGYYFALVYDCLERFVKIYNKLVKDNPEKAKEFNVSDGVEVNFDDWVQLYFHNLDFLLGQPIHYPHFIFRKRNKALEEAVNAEVKGGKTLEEALKFLEQDFQINPDDINAMAGKQIQPSDLELFFTSRETPIYEYLYESNSEFGFMDDECPIDHSYFMCHQINGLGLEEAEQVINEAQKMLKH